ncbi:hypothetical protein AbraIFM66950_009625 [Aspergillus brasiliensis]|nr:hypothetical protein AbraIFM66950_009625 [Aspergillus brasiliensis]
MSWSDHAVISSPQTSSLFLSDTRCARHWTSIISTDISPPQRFNPHGETNYQAIEEPILKGALGPCHVEKIELVHPTVLGAEEFQYQIWPEDETASWDAEFATATDSAPPHPWRHPKPNRAKL